MNKNTILILLKIKNLLHHISLNLKLQQTAKNENAIKLSLYKIFIKKNSLVIQNTLIKLNLAKVNQFKKLNSSANELTFFFSFLFD